MPETTEKLKMCPFCEGEIPLEATDCNYCGSSLLKTRRPKPAYPAEESLASLYEPPYSPHKRTLAPPPEPEPFDLPKEEEREVPQQHK
jgi:ribosomal protein L40E